MNQYPPRFFLSAQTPLGFVSRLSLLADPDRFPRVWLLKGGTRAKRSALIVRLAETAEESGQQVCRVLDPLAPMLLEAAFWDGFSVIDAAGPHPIEPRYPGAVERVVWLGECWDEQELAALRRDLIAADREHTRLLEQARRYLGAADTLWGDRFRMANEATDRAKIERQADRIAAQEFSRPHGDVREGVCLLSTTDHACGPAADAMESLGRVVLLEDEIGPSASHLLAALRRRGGERAQRMLCGYSPFSPYERLEQLIFPDLSLGFFTVNERLPAVKNPQRVINARRFTDREILAACKSRIAFHRKAARQMTLLAKETLALAREEADRIEQLYARAFCPERFELFCARLCAELPEG